MIDIRIRWGHLNHMPRCQHGRVICACFDAPSPDGRRMAETQNSGSGRKPDQQVLGSKLSDHPSQRT
jgi:hypothetical protein